MYLKKTADFAAIHRNGRWNGSRLLGVKSRNNNLDYTRCGIITSKKIGKAVVRNRIKRRIRELVRNCHIKTGHDIIIISRPGIENATFGEIGDSLSALLASQRLLENKNEIHCAIND